ncbi:MAG: hypothetical protein ACI9DC_000375 [Gammaproteobacteria bacterium]|jgi:hypothetical protein
MHLTVDYAGSNLVQKPGHEQAIRLRGPVMLRKLAGKQCAINTVLPKYLHAHQTIADFRKRTHCEDSERQIIEISRSQNGHRTRNSLNLRREPIKRTVYDAQQAARQIWIKDVVQALDIGVTIQDTFTVTASDGTTQLVTITINGAEDSSILGGTTAGNVSEDAASSVTGTRAIGDLDTSGNPMGSGDQTSTPDDNGYGSFKLTSGT